MIYMDHFYTRSKLMIFAGGAARESVMLWPNNIAVWIWLCGIARPSLVHIMAAVTVRQNYGYDGWLVIAASSAVSNTLTQISPLPDLLSLSHSLSLSLSISHTHSGRLGGLPYRPGNSYFLCVVYCYDMRSMLEGGGGTRQSWLLSSRAVPYDSW